MNNDQEHFKIDSLLRDAFLKLPMENFKYIKDQL